MQKSPGIILGLLVTLALGQGALLVGRGGSSSADPLPTVSPTNSFIPKPSPSETPTPSPSVSPTSTKTPTPPAGPFDGLGAWVDTYDFETLNATSTTQMLASKGVKTLYLQTGRWRSSRSIENGVGEWLAAGKMAGLEVVGWYVPNYSNMTRDISRTSAIATYSSGGHSFSGAAIAVYYREDVEGDAWNERAARHAAQVREDVGDFPLAAITPAPLQMDKAPPYWEGFPWKRLARETDALIVQAYWSFRDCPGTPSHCPEAFARQNVSRVRNAVDDQETNVHLVGGVAEAVTSGEVRAFVKGTTASGAAGISLYDVASMMGKGFWPLLQKFRPA